PDVTIDLASKSNSFIASSIDAVVIVSSDKISTREPLVKSIPGFNCKNDKDAIPIIINEIVKVKIFLRCFTISTRRRKIVGSTSLFLPISSISFFLTPNQPLRFVKKPLWIHKLNNNLVPNTAVKKLIKILTINIVANPLTEIVPKINRSVAVSNFLIHSYKIVTKEFIQPALKESTTYLHTRNSSLILSKVKTFPSTHIPTPKINAAIPGNVNTPFIN